MSVYTALLDQARGVKSRERLRTTLIGSQWSVERFHVPILLTGHTGCVNSILFSDCGSYAITASDDTKINLYDVATGERTARLHTKHVNNIFYAKDLPGTNMGSLVTCAADGRVYHMRLDGGGGAQSHLLYKHRGRAHRIGMVPSSASQFFSAGEDGVCNMYDLRLAPDLDARCASPPPSALPHCHRHRH